MPTLFISDLHLDPARPEVTQHFLTFLEREAYDSEALYILGDLFEAWLGDDDPDAHNRQVVEAMRKYTDTGRAGFFLRGNRDFLVGERFCDETGFKLLKEINVINLYGKRVLLMHGDELCTDDHEYQKFRRIVRNPFFKRLSDAAPIWLREKVGGKMRAASQQKTPLKSDAITDVNQAAVEKMMRAHDTKILLHGHTHRPAVHHFSIDGEPATRIVLGDWYEQGSVLAWNPERYELNSLTY
jgi:UDP-2,3-diacylglucosamine hydrolase